MPDEETYGPMFDKSKYGLVEVPRTESYRGLIFASYNPTVTHGQGLLHRLRLDPPVELIDTGDLTRDVLENTRRFNQILEGYVREYPDQWLWIHKRWKTRPEGEPDVYQQV